MLAYTSVIERSKSVVRPSTVKRRRKALGLLGSRSTMKTIDPADAEQLVFAQMDADISKRAGVRTIQRRIASEEKVHLPR